MDITPQSGPAFSTPVAAGTEVPERKELEVASLRAGPAQSLAGAREKARHLVEWFLTNGAGSGLAESLGFVLQSLNAGDIEPARAQSWPAGQSQLSSPEQGLRSLKAEIREICDIMTAASLAEWCQYLEPPYPIPHTPEDLIQLNKKMSASAHSRLTSRPLGRLLGFLSEEKNLAELSLRDQFYVREIRRIHLKESAIPGMLVERIRECEGRLYEAWEDARRTNDFSKTCGGLKEMLSLVCERARCLGYEKHPYQSCLNDYEAGAAIESLDRIFAGLKAELIELRDALQQAAPCRKAEIEAGAQMVAEISAPLVQPSKRLALARKAAGAMGLPLDRMLFGTTPHPFSIDLGAPLCAGLAVGSEEDAVSTLLSARHEGGHSLLALESDPFFFRSPILVSGSCASLALDEAVARLYEVLLGASPEHWSCWLPVIGDLFPEAKSLSPDLLLKYQGRFRDSPVRLKADEVHYNLHIIMRYELEKELFSGSLRVDDLPERWSMASQEYLGVKPKDAREGVLQDSHWFCGMFGYFPCYALGNMISAQLYYAMLKDIPQLGAKLARGDESPAAEWLGEKVFRKHGYHKSSDMVAQATGRPLQSGDYMHYLWNKYARLYGVQPPQRHRQRAT